MAVDGFGNISIPPFTYRRELYITGYTLKLQHHSYQLEEIIEELIKENKQLRQKRAKEKKEMRVEGVKLFQKNVDESNAAYISLSEKYGKLQRKYSAELGRAEGLLSAKEAENERLIEENNWLREQLEMYRSTASNVVTGGAKAIVMRDGKTGKFVSLNDKDNEEESFNLWLKGWEELEIANHLHLKLSTVQKYLQRKKKGWSPEVLDRMRMGALQKMNEEEEDEDVRENVAVVY